MEGIIATSDGSDVYSTDVGNVRGNIELKIRNFVKNYSRHKNNVFEYREQLKANVIDGKYFLEVDISDIQNFDESIKEAFYKHSSEFLSIFENVLSTIVKPMNDFKPKENFIEYEDGSPLMQVIVKDATNLVIQPRSLQSSHLSKVIRVDGIIVSISRVEPKVVKAFLRCRSCGKETSVYVPPCCGIVQYPRSCDGHNPVTGKKCPQDPYDIIPEKCKFVDKMILKLQETPENVAPGEVPRTVVVILERYLVSGLSAGQRIRVEGIYGASLQKKGTISSAYIRAIGIEKSNQLVPKDDEMMKEVARTITREKLIKSIAPAIYGHDDIKEAVLCLMIGGSRKGLPDGTRLRGDINVLLMGDPGTAKSQILKFVKMVSPIGVYTSGKGSSAAGLTAAVNKDSTTGEFYLEGGALVLGDGGVVCIDEFDKMNEIDRVAIHEAMEQQTISIAKAGITAVLNARAAVLAAANPIFGKFNDRTSFGNSINLKATVLSRFDMIFMIRDVPNKENDSRIVRHILDVHRKEVHVDNLNVETLKNYISYCKEYCVPRLTESASSKLADYFVNIRQKVREAKEKNYEDDGGVPITVRQLEAIIRISESLAKMTMSDIAEEKHVEEAIRLFEISTMKSATEQPKRSKKKDQDV
ncbi:DNA replication licensing factor mcm5, putative [Entamoeba invadens IP1]|uniref:DNA replication licensing factor MCM5 n=1 Tax=Entamoeba invadens IP1 TaxID=370355 RepID=A0A0A1U242_ENTIV|nr:DNA replication licensing factor mcm5, putative [Entamoeba invadens IP1]ELP88089.1 DNA replication licensing factor mcm5, putative [Entamoeba invadens IP1]|eukprot:XP_004254860.1 DNA replication licensing factor mcm5, putative [Entamoeba invadens IP1]